MLGGAWFRKCFGDVDCCDVDYIVETAISVVVHHLHIHDKPVAVIPHILKVSQVSGMCCFIAALSLQCSCAVCTLCLKKVPTFKLSVTLSNLSRFLKFLHCWKAYQICYKTHLTLGMLLHYLGILKIQIIFCKYSEDLEKMQTNCIFSALILIPLRT